MNTKEDAISLHRMLKGKIEIQNKVSIENAFDEDEGTLGLVYTPGLAYVATEISNNKELVYDYTSKWNNVAIICDGTRVLGLGNIGPEGALPIMEGKSVLFKILGGMNAFPSLLSLFDYFFHFLALSTFISLFPVYLLICYTFFSTQHDGHRSIGRRT